MEQTNSQVWKTQTIKYLKENFSKKNNILRLIVLSCVLVVFIPWAVAMNVWAQHSQYAEYGSGFISISIVTNSGMAFSFMSNSPEWTVYMIQWLVTLVILGIVLFCKKWYYIALWTCAFLGGLFNVIDRACAKTIVSMGSQIQYNCVVDYFKFNFKWGIFNVPDIFVCVGSIGAIVIYLIQSIISLFKKDEKNK